MPSPVQRDLRDRPRLAQTFLRRAAWATIRLFPNALKGLSAVQLSRSLDGQHETSFGLMHKLREAMTAKTRKARLDGEVEADGDAFGGCVRPANLRERRIDRRRLANRSGKRRVVVVLPRRGGRTLTRTFLRKGRVMDFARERVTPGSLASADEIAHRDMLDPGFDMRRIDRSGAYSRGGAHTNLAESYNDAQCNRVAGRPDAMPCRFATMRRLDDFEHHGVRQRLSAISGSRSTITRSATSRGVISAPFPSPCTQIPAISPFLKNPWLTMERARLRLRRREQINGRV